MPSLEFEKEKKSFIEYYDEKYNCFEEASESFSTLIRLLLSDTIEIAKIENRVKKRDECISKFDRKYRSNLEEEAKPYEIKDYITDIIGIRIVTYYESDILNVNEILNANFKIIEITDKTKNLEKSDDVFGYKGLHLDLILNNKRIMLPEYSKIKDYQFEVQIRTIVQDSWSTLDHKIKYKKSIPHKLKRRINRLAALFELADQEFENIREETNKLLESYENVKFNDLLFPWSELLTRNLNAFLFIDAMKNIFPSYTFYGHKVDGFVDEISSINPEITIEKIGIAIKENRGLIEEYKTFQYEMYFNTLNPYTLIRHYIYLMDKEKNRAILFDQQRNTFDEWLKEHKS